jgi:ADP-heptose:LPS heptosyltransferase
LLTINFGGLGDEVLFLPALKSIREAHPDWHITLLLEPRSKSICQITDLIDDCLTFDIKKKPLLPTDLWQLLTLIRGGKFDVAVSSGSSPQVALLLFLSGIKQRIGYNSNQLAPLLLTSAVPLNRQQYAGLMYHDLVRGLGIESEPGLPIVTVDAKALEKMAAELEAAAQTTDTTGGAIRSKLRVVLHPGTSRLAVQKGIIKTWPAANWANLIDNLLKQDHLEVLLAGGPDDEEPIGEIRRELGKTAEHPRFRLMYGKTKSLKDLVALLHVSDLIICVDSAPMHIAVALNKPTIAMFAPTDPFRLIPDQKPFVALTNPVKQQLPDSTAPSRGVLIQPDTVFQIALDQLKQS